MDPNAPERPAASERESAETTPWFSAEEQPALMDYWSVYKTHYESLTAASMVYLRDHPEFGPLINSMSPEQVLAQSRQSYDLLERAVHGDWTAYEANLRQQGDVYARMGITFSGWFDITRIYLRYFVPAIVQAFEHQPARLCAALAVAQELIDHAMGLLGQTYIQTKESLVAEQRELAEQRARELARSEASLRRQTVILESVLNTLRDGVAVCDQSGRFVVYNRAAERLLGPRPPDSPNEGAPAPASPDEPSVFLPDGVTVFPLAEMPMQRALHNEASDDVEMLVRNPRVPNGVMLRVDGRPLDLGDSAPGGLVTFRDITERRRSEEIRRRSAELEAQNRRIEEANRLKSEFLANMSHELRTPLNAIIGFAELMHDGRVGPVAPQHQEFLGDILASGHHLLQLINDVLDLAKVEAGKLEFRPDRVDLHRLMTEVVGILRTNAAARKIHVSIDVDSSLGEVEVDPARLKQVLYNYLSNALKFTPEGGRVIARARPEGLEAFRIEVEDTGIGISPRDLGTLFAEFHQLDAGMAKRHAGTGLGLALTRRLVEAQGGGVGVRSEPDKGSVFHAVLPRRSVGTAALPSPKAFPAARSGAPSVLVVDDDASDQASIVSLLLEAGYEVETASTGVQALARCQERTFDAITLDLLLPDVSGLTVLNELRAEGRNRKTPVVVVSVVAEKGAVRGYAVDGILSKPVEASLLLAVLSKAAVSPGHKGAVMVVDDNLSSLRLIEATLAQSGYQVVCKSDAESALAAAREEAPIAVVLDLLMPGVDGFEFLDRFRHTTHNRHTPVIVWTMKDLTPEEQARLRVAAQAVVIKGRGARSLLEELQVYLPGGAGQKG